MANTKFTKGQKIVRVVAVWDPATSRYNMEFWNRTVESCGAKQIRLVEEQGVAHSLAFRGEEFHADMDSAKAYARKHAASRTNVNMPE